MILLDYPVYLAPPDHDHLGDGKKILIPPVPALGFPGAGFLFPVSLYILQQLPAACAPSYGPQAAFLLPCPAGQERGQNTKPP